MNEIQLIISIKCFQSNEFDYSILMRSPLWIMKIILMKSIIVMNFITFLYYIMLMKFDRIHPLGKLSIILLLLFLSHKFIESNTLIDFINLMKLTTLIKFTNWEFHYVDDKVHHIDQILCLVEVGYLAVFMIVKQLN